jgi:hypothetical protein
MGLFNLGGGGGLFGEGFADRLSIAGALVNGDYGAASQIKARQAQQREMEERRKQEQELGQKAYSVAKGMGLSDDEAQLIAADPGQAAQLIGSKFKQPAPNDTERDMELIRQRLGDEAADKFLRSKTEPMVMTPYGPMPYSAVNPEVPKAPVGKLTPIGGGPTGLPQSGGFPPFQFP